MRAFSFPRRLAAFCYLLLSTIVVLSAGCEERIITDYGASGSGDNGSIAGFSVLAKMIESNQCTVSRRRVLTPSLAKSADVIVWAPDDEQPATPLAANWLTNWLDEDPNRLLVYIGRDYHPLADYWRSCLENNKDPKLEPEILARLQEAEQNARTVFPMAKGGFPTSHLWFNVDRTVARGPVRNLSGRWSEGVNAAASRVQCPPTLTPVDAQAETLLACEFGILAFRANNGAYVVSEPAEYLPADSEEDSGPISSDEAAFEQGEQVETVEQSEESIMEYPAPSTGQVIVIANASYLVNMALVNHEHQRLASKLVDEIGPQKNVVMLESGFGGPRVAENDPQSELPTILSLFQLPKLGFSLIHLAVFAAVLTFSKLPLFGRPKELTDDKTRDFGQHVAAFAELLRRGRHKEFARSRLEEYQRSLETDRKS